METYSIEDLINQAVASFTVDKSGRDYDEDN
jgi:hypothetical protein